MFRIFSRPKQAVLACAFTFFLASLFGTHLLPAQTDTLSQKKAAHRLLDEVVVRTEKPSPFRPVAKVIAILGKDDILQAPVRNLPDLLRYIQGVDLRCRGVGGVQADLNIMGGTFDQTRVYINGVDFTDPQTGHHSLNIPVHPSQIERIEVLQSPQAINIVTSSPLRRPKKIQAEVGLGGGSHGFFQAYRNIAWRGLQIGGDCSRSDGYTRNTDFVVAQSFGNWHWQHGKGHEILFQTGYQRKKFGAQSFYTPKFPEQYEKTSLVLASLAYGYAKNGFELRATLYGRRHWDHFELFRYEAPAWYKGHNYHRNDLRGILLSAAYDWGKVGITSLAGEYRHESILSSNLGHPLEVARGRYKLALARSVPSLALKHAAQWGRFRLNAGITLWDRHLFGDFTASVALSPHFEMNLQVGESYRNPSFTDLFYKSPTQQGNSDLKSEAFLTSAWGFHYYHPGGAFRWNGTVFHRYGYRIIDWFRKSSDEQWQAGNLTHVHSFGCQTQMQYRQVGLGYTGLKVIKETGDYHSLYATDYLQHKLTLFGHHPIGRHFSALWNLSYHKRAGTYLDVNNLEVKYKPFVLANIRLTWDAAWGRRVSVRFFADVNNILNTKYMDIGTIEQPGITAKGGVVFRFM